jgi:type I restriction-modification system DNA methylase subunit
MDKQTAVKIIRDTFERPFDKGQYVYFVKNLFNKIEIEEGTFKNGYYGQFIPDAFKPYISKYGRIGKYNDGNNRIDILVVYLGKEKLIERARTMQRNFIAGYLNGKYGSNTMKDAALVAFISPNEDDWRFSLVKMEYKLTRTETGRVKAKEELTPVRRYSFLVGKNEPNHTAQSRLYPLLKDDINNPTLAQLEDAFNIETVTEEFFENYRDLFIRVKEAMDDMVKKYPAVRKDFTEKRVDTVDFAKKLMGQIVFLYFLQKKGWFGVEKGKDWGTGSKRFLRDLYDGKIIQYKNFFNDILEPLFYEALAQDRSYYDHYYEHFKTKIPFLNGGLFDPIKEYDWVNTDILLPDELFSNNKKNKTGDIGDGILDIFDRYNFTVREDEPLEKEVAIDPELLGKAYEKFNAIRADNFDEYKKALRNGQKGAESKFNKQYGVYYTPREIVHYMCQQSLINYLVTELSSSPLVGDGQSEGYVIPSETRNLKEAIEFLIINGEKYIEYFKTAREKKEEGIKKSDYKETKYFIELKNYATEIDNLLANIRVCDPAIGSGAFPVGMMTEIIKARLFFLETKCLSEYYENIQGEKVKRNAYNYKRDCIQNSLYGVDIDPGAIEIAKLRLWLSLVVDEEDIKTIKPLPNLDYKIMQGNSLLEEYEGIKLIDEKFFQKGEDKTEIIRSLEDELKKLQKEYFNLHEQKQIDRVKKIQLEQNIKKTTEAINKLKLTSDSDNENLTLFVLSEAKQKAEKLLDLQKQFFDASHKSDKNKSKDEIEHLIWDLIETTLKEQDKEDKIKEIIHFKETNTKPFFLWHLNFANVFQEKGGFDVVIANPPYVGQKGNKKLFDEMSKNKYFEKKMDYWYFFLHKGYDISNECGVTCFITPNYWITAQGGKKIRDKIVNYYKIIEYINFNENKIFEAGIHTNVFLLKKEKTQDNQIRCCIYQNVYEENVFDNRKNELNFETNQSLVFNKWTGFVHFLPDHILRIIDKLFLNCEKLSDNESVGVKKKGVIAGKKVTNGICNINQGLVTGKDRYINKIKKISRGVFILNQDEINTYKLTKKEEHYIKMFFKNSDMDRYYLKKKSKYYLLYINDIEDEETFKSYTNLYKHFLGFKSILEERAINGVLESAYKKGKWWALTTDRPNIDFSGEKILCPQRSSTNTFAYSDNEWYASADVYYISPNKDNYSLKYILSILNSRLVYFWLYWMGKRKGEVLELYLEPLQFIPIKIIDNHAQQPFIYLVDKILAMTKDEDYLTNPTKQTKVKEYERQIDQMVYKLYGLTSEEIKIVENF